MAIVISLVLLFLGIGILVLIHICIVGRAFRRELANDESRNIMERSSNGSTSMYRDDLEKLPCFDFEDKEKGSSPVDCAVCLEKFKAGDKCRLLPLCMHSFHAECVDLWLLKMPICPICRANAADLLIRTGPVLGEESSRHSEIELRENQDENGGLENSGAVELVEGESNC